MKITIIGSGNIGSALVSGLLRNGTVQPKDITLTDVNQDALVLYASKGIITSRNNPEAVKSADMVILCVKPFMVRTVIEEISSSLTDKMLLVSFAAGINLNQLSLFAGKRPLYRVIPNTAMAVNQSMTCIAGVNTTEGQNKMMLDFFNLVGMSMMIDESLMNAATVIASCGTAFALRYMRAATTAAVEIGFKPSVAVSMIAQTMLGAAALIHQSKNHPEQEIDKVTTPKGITIKGLNEMEHAGFSSAVMQGILAAYEVFDI
ncbi:MAG: pyrroline-5-carboxylate reductase [Bacteroidales bacterium]|jgi:pyrroline-5-carboxylate reductase|nr:pyrroline-5-carboxylate reductase [Bacteroidales bacterium]